MSDTLELIERLTPQQEQDLLRMYQEQWWTQGRSLGEIRKMLTASDLVFGYASRAEGSLVAFARVLTDYVYKAFIFDVIVDSPRQGKGLGRRLVQNILAHPAIAQVQHAELYCAQDRTGFYGPFGFECVSPPMVLMRRHQTPTIDRQAARAT